MALAEFILISRNCPPWSADSHSATHTFMGSECSWVTSLTVFIQSWHPSCARWAQPTPSDPVYLNIGLSSKHIIPNGVFLWDFTITILYAFLISLPCYTPVHLILPHLMPLTVFWKVRIMNLFHELAGTRVLTLSLHSVRNLSLSQQNRSRFLKIG